MKRFKLRRRRQSGQALVEFALVLPILLMLLIGIVEFGRAWNLKHVLVDAAREGARRAVIADPTITEDSVRTRIDEVIRASSFDPSLAAITITGFHAGTGKSASVRIQYPYQFRFLAPFVDLVFASSDGVVQLATEAQMRNE